MWISWEMTEELGHSLSHLGWEWRAKAKECSKKPTSMCVFHAALFIYPAFAGPASHAWLVHYHWRNIAEYCCLCLYLVQGQPRHRNQHRWCLYIAFWPGCGAGVDPCCYVLWWRVLSHHTALLCLGRAWGILLGADPAPSCSVVACGGTETQKVAGGKLQLVCTFFGPDTVWAPGTTVAWGPRESWMELCFSCQQTFSSCYL